MKVSVRQNQQELSILNLEGDLDYHVSTELRTALNRLIENHPPKVLINLQKVSYIDSSGLAAFVELSQKVKQYQGSLAFFSLPDSVRQIFELAKLHLFFKLAATEKEAVALLDA